MSTPRIERETTIVFNEEEGHALVWSASPVFQRRIEKLGVPAYKTESRGEAGVAESRYYKIPKPWVKIRLPHKTPDLTDEQRKARAEATRARFSKRASSEDAVFSPGEKSL